MRAAITIALVCLASGRASADNPDFARARTLAGELRYDEAAVAVDAAIKRGGAAPKELAAMYKLAGILAGGLHQPELAARHFARALAIDPSVTLPLGASPKLTRPFAAAKSRLAGRRLSLTAAVSGRRASLTAADPVSLIARVRIERRAGAVVARLAGPPFQHTAAGDGPESLIAVAVDASGNRLAEVSFEIAGAATGPTDGDSRSLWRGPLPWLAGAAVAGAAGITFGLLARSAQSDVDDLSERARDDPFSVPFEDVEDARRRGERRALIANVSFAVAGAAAIAGGVIWLLGRGDGDGAIEPGPGGVAVRF